MVNPVSGDLRRLLGDRQGHGTAPRRHRRQQVPLQGDGIQLPAVPGGIEGELISVHVELGHGGVRRLLVDLQRLHLHELVHQGVAVLRAMDGVGRRVPQPAGGHAIALLQRAAAPMAPGRGQHRFVIAGIAQLCGGDGGAVVQRHRAFRVPGLHPVPPIVHRVGQGHPGHVHALHRRALVEGLLVHHFPHPQEFPVLAVNPEAQRQQHRDGDGQAGVQRAEQRRGPPGRRAARDGRLRCVGLLHKQVVGHLLPVCGLAHGVLPGGRPLPGIALFGPLPEAGFAVSAAILPGRGRGGLRLSPGASDGLALSGRRAGLHGPGLSLGALDRPALSGLRAGLRSPGPFLGAGNGPALFRRPGRLCFLFLALGALDGLALSGLRSLGLLPGAAGGPALFRRPGGLCGFAGFTGGGYARDFARRSLAAGGLPSRCAARYSFF